MEKSPAELGLWLPPLSADDPRLLNLLQQAGWLETANNFYLDENPSRRISGETKSVVCCSVVKLKPMKRVIRNAKTGLFLKGKDWTDNIDEALHFDSIPEVVRAWSIYHLKDTELVLMFGRRELDIAVPICT